MPEGTAELHMNFIKAIKDFFKAPKVDPVANAALDAFSDASDACDTASHAVDTYTNRANHRYAILIATYDFEKSGFNDSSAEANYAEAIAAADPADLDQYTEAYLDSHTAAMDAYTAAMDALTTTFDKFTAAFSVFNPPHELYASAAALYKSMCVIYAFAADGYYKAAHCAMMTALRGNVQAVKDTFDLSILEIKASNPASANYVVAKAEAAAFKTKATEDANKAKRLEQKATVAKTKAEVFLSKAKAAEARAKEALEICG